MENKGLPEMIGYIIGLVVTAVVLVVLLIYLKGVVIQDLWNWFLTMKPIGLAPLTSRWHAVGIAILLSVLTQEVTVQPARSRR